MLLFRYPLLNYFNYVWPIKVREMINVDLVLFLFYPPINESRLLQVDLQLDVGRVVRRIVGRDPGQPQRRERGAEEGEQRRSGAHRGDVRLGGGRKWNAR